MSYIKQTWVDRAVEFFRRFSVAEDSAGNITLTEEAGTITEAGTPVNAEHLNHMEDGIEAAHGDLAAHLAENASTSNRGHVQLSSSLTSTSTTLGATASAVKNLQDNKQNKGRPSRVSLSLQNGWSGLAYAYKTEDDIVIIYINDITRTTDIPASNTTIAVLPEGFNVGLTQWNVQAFDSGGTPMDELIRLYLTSTGVLQTRSTLSGNRTGVRRMIGLVGLSIAL